LPVNGVK